MDSVFVEALQVMERAFRRLELQVPPPIKQEFGDSFAIRYAEQTAEQAILQKCARVVSTLAAARVLLANGFVQEQGLLQRVLDELGDDVLLLASAPHVGPPEALYFQFLTAFWAEEHSDPEDVVGTSQARNLVPRRKIHAYVSRLSGTDNPSRDLDVSQTISRAYSGYVHGASPHIMDMCIGSPPRFMLFGMSGTHRISEHTYDIWNYYYRALLTLALAAKKFGDAVLVEQLYDYMDVFERKTGRVGGVRGSPSPHVAPKES
jgi:hypothetical protein